MCRALYMVLSAENAEAASAWQMFRLTNDYCMHTPRISAAPGRGLRLGGQDGQQGHGVHETEEDLASENCFFPVAP